MSVHNSTLLDTAGLAHLSDARIALFSTQWNDFIVDELVSGCLSTLQENGITETTAMQVPGSFELPFASRRYFETTKGTEKEPDAIIAFGCVIKGETPHFDYVCQAVTAGITELNVTLPVPVIFGVLTVDDVEQARDRIGGVHGHKGKEAALTALQMIAFNRKLK